MSLVDQFRVEQASTPVIKLRIAGYSERDIAFWGIEDIKNTLLAAGWTISSKLAAQGLVYAPGWSINKQPTRFRELYKNGENSQFYRTLNDQCSYDGGCTGEALRNPYNGTSGASSLNGGSSACEAGGSGPWFNFGVPQTECHRQCANGCSGPNGNCPCGHTCCSEDDDCTVHLDTTSTGCDSSGNYCGGSYTGTYETFATKVVGGSCYYTSEIPPSPPLGSIGYGYNVLIKAKEGGPAWNAPLFETSVGVGLSVSGLPAIEIYGGGYVMKSGVNPTTGEQYYVSIYQNITGGISFKIGNAEFFLTLNKALFPVAPVYKMLANRCQFIIFDTSTNNDGVGSFGRGGNSLAVTSPWVKPGVGISSAIVAIGPGTLMNNVLYGSTVCVAWINNGEYIANSDASVLRAFGGTQRNYSFAQSLRTSNNKYLINNAWLFAPVSNTDEARIIGKWWGGMVLSDVSPKNARGAFEDVNYSQISRQDNPTVCSLWIQEGDEI